MNISLNILDLIMIVVAIFALGGIAGHRFLPSRSSKRHEWLEQREMAWMALSALIYRDCTPSLRKALDIARNSHGQAPPR